MAGPRHVAIIDVGKTNSKVSLVDGRRRVGARVPHTRQRDQERRPLSASRRGRHLGLRLRRARRPEPRGARSTRSPSPRTARPAPSSIGNPEGDGLALPIIDYEFPARTNFAADYDRAAPGLLRDALAPASRRPQSRRADLLAGAALPEGIRAAATLRQLSAILGLAALRRRRHRDVLDGRALRHVEPARAPLVEPGHEARLGEEARAASLRFRSRLGRSAPALAKKLGLDPETAVHCGIHDSSASLLPHLKARTPPFARRLDRHLGHHLRRRRRSRRPRSRARHARQCQRLRRSGRLRALHGRTRVRAADAWRPGEAERR